MYLRMRQQSLQSKFFYKEQPAQENTTPVPDKQANVQPETNQPQEQSDGYQAADPACVRQFNQEILKTAKVDIKNRQVEMDIKNFGKITLEFYDQDAPKTVENFLRLTNAGFYNCLTFHRVIKGFMIQGGDPTGTGMGGISAFGKEFADEIKPTSALYKAGYKKGLLAMANKGPNTNSSQFFILQADYPLKSDYTIFGKVISGQEVVDKIVETNTNPQNDAPINPVIIESVKISK